jgi:SAM-dependent methyltransferase
MEQREYERLREFEVGYWWHTGRRRLLRTLLERHVPRDPGRPALDIGCGTGANFELLAPWGRFVGTEVSHELFRPGRARPSRPVVLARGEELPFADSTFELCTFFDVLEHVGPEDRFLSEVVRVLRPGGVVLLSVPAYMFLWSAHDVSLHHHRRYVRRTLTASLARNGLEPRRVTYAMASILAPVAAVRLLSRFGIGRRTAGATYVRTPAPAAKVLEWLLAGEALWLRRADLPFGTSLLAIARKPAEGAAPAAAPEAASKGGT